MPPPAGGMPRRGRGEYSAHHTVPETGTPASASRWTRREAGATSPTRRRASTFRDGDGERTATVWFGRLTGPDPKPCPWVGVNTWGIWNGHPFRDDPAWLDLLSAAGFSRVRTELWWANVEPKPGQYSVPERFETATDELCRRGIGTHYLLSRQLGVENSMVHLFADWGTDPYYTELPSIEGRRGMGYNPVRSSRVTTLEFMTMNTSPENNTGATPRKRLRLPLRRTASGAVHRPKADGRPGGAQHAPPRHGRALHGRRLLPLREVRPPAHAGHQRHRPHDDKR